MGDSVPWGSSAGAWSARRIHREPADWLVICGTERSFCRSPCLVGHAGRGLASGGPLTLLSWQLSRVPAPARLSRHSFLTKLPLQVARRLQLAWMAQLGAFFAL